MVQGDSRTTTTTAWGAMAEVFSDDLNLKIGDLIWRPLSPATCQPCARPLMLTRTIQAYSCVFARAPVHPCAPATRAHNLLLAMYSQALSPGDLLSRSLSHATSPPWRAPRCFSARYTRHLGVCARARSRMRARYTRAPAVAYARSRVSKPIRVRRGGEEACFLHLYEPYVALGFVFLDSMPSGYSPARNSPFFSMFF
jgi:hypothetical protein